LRVFPATAVDGALLGADEQEAAGYAAGRALLRVAWRAGTGVIAPNDNVALGFMRAAAERGLAAGEDYAIVGFDDWHREAHLTSLRPPLDALGEEGARLVARLLRGEDAVSRIALQHQLIARSSSAPAGCARRKGSL